jgi:hypothetical protein
LPPLFLPQLAPHPLVRAPPPLLPSPLVLFLVLPGVEAVVPSPLAVAVVVVGFPQAALRFSPAHAARLFTNAPALLPTVC